LIASLPIPVPLPPAFDTMPPWEICAAIVPLM
jgi:hypothetical protein